MVKIALIIAVAAVLGAPVPGRVGLVPAASAAVLSAQAMYADAVAKDQAVRQAIETGMPAAALRKAVRTVFAAYDALVRQYPTSGYSDDALWRAAQLATDAAALVKDAAYHATASRYLRRLAAEYPSSTHARQVPAASLSDAALSANARTAALQVPAPIAPVNAPVTPVVPVAPVVPVLDNAAVAARAATPTAVPAVAVAAAPSVKTTKAEKARLLAIHRAVLPDVVRITLDIDQEVAFHQERLSGPDRIFFDFAGTTTARSLAERTMRFDQDTDIVRQVRIGQRSSETTRVVLDATGVASCSVSPLYAPYRLVIDCVRASATASGASAEAPPKPRTPATLARKAAPTPPVASTPAAGLATVTPVTAADKAPRGVTPPSVLPGLPALPAPPVLPPVLVARRIPVNPLVVPTAARLPPGALVRPTAEASEPPQPAATESPVAAAAGSDAASAPPLTTRAEPVATRAAPSAAPTAPARNLDGGFSIARQLGLTVSRIVIDPGHGGHDPGAKGAGVTEAAVVLDIALRLEKLLVEEGVEVILTRRTDDFVALEERTVIANREGADLFLSIHANASSIARAAGVETYFLNFARDRNAAAVAARENAASGKPMSALPDVVKTIAMNGKVDESRDFATQVQRALVQKLKPTHQGLRDLGVKQAPFVVLIGATMPSVLAEVSFMTNDQEAKLLKAQNYRQRIAEALFAGVQRYQSSLTRVAGVAGQ